MGALRVLPPTRLEAVISSHWLCLAVPLLAFKSSDILCSQLVTRKVLTDEYLLKADQARRCHYAGLTALSKSKGGQ